MLLIDQTAAARSPDPEALRQWLANQRVFISSAMADTGLERLALAAAIREEGAKPRLFGIQASNSVSYWLSIEKFAPYRLHWSLQHVPLLPRVGCIRRT